MIRKPDIPSVYYFKVSPGYMDFSFGDVEHYNAVVKLYKKSFWGDKHIATISIPGTDERKHPTQEQVEEAMRTAALYATP